MRELQGNCCFSQVDRCESSFSFHQKEFFSLSKDLEAVLSANFSSYELRHPWLKAALMKDFPFLYQELYYGDLLNKSSASSVWIKRMIHRFDYVFPPEIQEKKQKSGLPSEFSFSLNGAELENLKKHFLEEYTLLLQEEFQGYFQHYQKEYRFFDLLFPFMCFLLRTLDQALSNFGPWFQEILRVYKESLKDLAQEASSRVRDTNDQIDSDLFMLEKLLFHKDIAFLQKTIAFLEARGYIFHSYGKFEKQFKKSFPDLFSKKIFLNALKKGAHENVVLKKPHLGALELHKILGWRIIVLKDPQFPEQRVIEGIYTDHDQYMKRLAFLH